MTNRKSPKQTPMQQAVAELFNVEPYSGGASPEQIAEVAERFELEPHALEGVYLEAVDRLADS